MLTRVVEEMVEKEEGKKGSNQKTNQQFVCFFNDWTQEQRRRSKMNLREKTRNLNANLGDFDNAGSVIAK